MHIALSSAARKRDRATAQALHVGGHILRREELVLEVDGDAGVPAFGRGVFDAMAHIVGRVVQQRSDRPEALAHRLDRGAQGGEIGQSASTNSGALRASASLPASALPAAARPRGHKADLEVGSDPVHKVSIIPRGIGALGYTIQRPTEDRYLMTRSELEQKIAVLMGGHAAEKLVFGQLSTGASDDLAKATDIARAMVSRYGMDEGLGYIAFEAPRQTMLDLPTGMLPNASPVSEDTQRRIDDAIRAIVMGSFDRATAILGVNRDVLERSARALLEKETLDEAAIRSLTAALRSE